MTETEFNQWADKVGVSGMSRDAVRLIEVEGLSINAAARQTGLAPSTVSRAHARYRFPLCPCCGQSVPLDAAP